MPNTYKKTNIGKTSMWCPTNMIERKIDEDFKKRLNVTALPSDIKEMIKERSAEVGVALIEQDISKRALLYGKEILREVDHAKAIDERLSSALKGVELVSKSADLQNILSENAKMMFAKKQALVKAGFTDDEAFQLIMAEVSAKKSK